MTKSVTMTSDVNSEAEQQPPFATLIGMNIIHVSKDKIVAELPVREELNNRFGALHGGAVMALADNPRRYRHHRQFAERRTHATIESKTSFFASIPVGDVARAECTPQHRGRTTMVWQTRVTRSDDRLCALVIQTQIVMPAAKS